MSIAVAIQKNRSLVLGTDSQCTFGDLRVPQNVVASKIRQVGAAYLAATGWGIYDDILNDYLLRTKNADLSSRPAVFAFFMAFWKELHEHYPFVKDQPEDGEHSPFGDLDASFLIVSPQGIFHVSGNMTVTEFARYYAIGSGCEYALGAASVLYGTEADSKTICREAVEAAIEFNIYCGGDVDIVELD